MNKSEIAERAEEFAADLPEECWGYTVNHKQFVKALTLFGERAITESQAPPDERYDHVELCQKCGRLNPVWFAPNPVWNAVVTEISGILCPICFIERADKQGFRCTGWELIPENSQILTDQKSASNHISDMELGNVEPSPPPLQGHWFVTRRVVKKAVQWNGNNEYEIADFMPAEKFNISDSGAKLFIETPEGCMEANVLDWIIRGVNGEFYPCKPDIFAKTYEPFELGDGEPSPPPLPDECLQCGAPLEGGKCSVQPWHIVSEYVDQQTGLVWTTRDGITKSRSGAAQEVSPRSWSEQMAQVHPCGHTEAQHMYHTEGYIKLDLSECTSNGVPSIPAKAEAHKADAVKAVSASSAQEVSPPSPPSNFVNSSGDDPWFLQFQLVSAKLEKAEGDTRELKAAANKLIDYCIAHDWGMMPEPYDSINPLLKLLGRFTERSGG